MSFLGLLPSRVPLLLLIAAAFSLLLPPSSLALSNEDLQSGQFKTRDGSTCTWFELRKSPNEVTFGMACQCRTEEGRGQGYTCHYFGNPDDCEAYQEGGREFYGAFVDKIVETCDTGCDLEVLSHDRCPDNQYTRAEYTPAEKPCYPHKKERYEL